MSKISWFRGPEATADELEKQLSAARAELTKATAAEQAAQDAFDVDPTAGEKGLIASREATVRATEHVGRAERLLGAARAREELFSPTIAKA